MTYRGSKAKILECAQELFYYCGYQTTSVEDILQRSGVAKSNFYYHFSSKEQLALAVLEERMVVEEQRLLRLLSDTTQSPAERLNQFCLQLCRTQRDLHRLHGCPFGNWAATLAAEDDPQQERFREKLSQIFRQMENVLSLCLKEGMERGEFRADVSPSEAAVMALAVAEGSLLLTKTHRDAMPLQAGLALLQRLLHAT